MYIQFLYVHENSKLETIVNDSHRLFASKYIFNHPKIDVMKVDVSLYMSHGRDYCCFLSSGKKSVYKPLIYNGSILHLAFLEGCLPVLNLLVKAGCSIYRPSIVTPYHFSRGVFSITLVRKMHEEKYYGDRVCERKSVADFILDSAFTQELLGGELNHVVEFVKTWGEIDTSSLKLNAKYKDIFLAVLSGDSTRVRSLLDTPDIEINHKDNSIRFENRTKFNRTLLHWIVVRELSIDILQRILNKHIINLGSFDNYSAGKVDSTPIILAIRLNNVDYVKLLLDAEDSPGYLNQFENYTEARTGKIQNILTLAVSRGSYDIVELILDKVLATEGINLDFSFYVYYTENKKKLSTTILNRLIALKIKKLVKIETVKNAIKAINKVNPGLIEVSMNYGVTSFEHCVYSKYWNIIRLVKNLSKLCKFKLNSIHNGATPLLFAALNADTDIVDILIEFGADICQVITDNLPITLLLAKQNKWDMLKYIFSNHAEKFNINCTDSMHENILFYAAKQDLDTSKFFVDQKVLHKMKNFLGETIEDWLKKYRKHEMLAYLQGRTADVEVAVACPAPIVHDLETNKSSEENEEDSSSSLSGDVESKEPDKEQSTGSLYPELYSTSEPTQGCHTMPAPSALPMTALPLPVYTVDLISSSEKSESVKSSVNPCTYCSSGAGACSNCSRSSPSYRPRAPSLDSHTPVDLSISEEFPYSLPYPAVYTPGASVHVGIVDKALSENLSAIEHESELLMNMRIAAENYKQYAIRCEELKRDKDSIHCVTLESIRIELESLENGTKKQLEIAGEQYSEAALNYAKFKECIKSMARLV